MTYGITLVLSHLGTDIRQTSVVNKKKKLIASELFTRTRTCAHLPILLCPLFLLLFPSFPIAIFLLFLFLFSFLFAFCPLLLFYYFLSSSSSPLFPLLLFFSFPPTSLFSSSSLFLTPLSFLLPFLFFPVSSLSPVLSCPLLFSSLPPGPLLLSPIHIHFPSRPSSSS